MGLPLDGHHRRVVDLRLHDVRSIRTRMQLLKRRRVRLQVLLGSAVVRALAFLGIAPSTGHLPCLHGRELPLQLVLL
jgi:hypothetical protein